MTIASLLQNTVRAARYRRGSSFAAHDHARGRPPRGEARAARAQRGGDRALPGTARRDPAGGLEGVGARPLRRAADLAPARARQRAGRGRAGAVARARRGVRERARGRGRRVPGAGEVIDTLRLTAEAANDLLATRRGVGGGAPRRLRGGDRARTTRS